jgi:hypothetical protein
MWLRSVGVDIPTEKSQGGAVRVALGDLYASEVLDHVGFAASDLSAVVAVRERMAPRRFARDGGLRALPARRCAAD